MCRALGSLVIAIVLAACGGVDPGAACSVDGDCGGRMICVVVDEMRSACMAPCDDATWVCADGSVCLASPSNGRVCWFGGPLPFDAECAAELDCEPGGICQDGVCTQSCQLTPPAYLDPDDVPEFDPASVCDEGQVCQPLAWDGSRGYCSP
ncbi:hypothetical protein [Sandaracinus amylolyticus]|uniref:Lipoprotein n=1 Tax=Sandaracinus amylolyticus TaxID=927083 RepID=A0A0F6SG40_9BACT|nr:hypothetical protein [Sandaracinus amylolyticus]AKF08029.1 hypothetical protein DB32_005178 [Sandaracinus amylolyticus]